MKLRIVSDGTTKGTHIVDIATGEKIDNIQRLVITADARDGLVNAYFEVVGVEYDVTVEAEEKKKELLGFIPSTAVSVVQDSEFPSLPYAPPLEKKHRGRKKPEPPDPTRYTEDCINIYETTTAEGDGLSDLEYVKNHGIHSDDRLSWYIWFYFKKKFAENKKVRITAKDIEDYIRITHAEDLAGRKIKFDRTTINHNVNKFHFLGLLIRRKRKESCTYFFPKIVKKWGIDWFRKGNKYLEGHFQSDSEGFLDLTKEIK
jgi:hypothetical protein